MIFPERNITISSTKFRDNNKVLIIEPVSINKLLTPLFAKSLKIKLKKSSSFNLLSILIFLTYLYVSITINSRGFFIYVLALIILYFMFYCNYNLGILKKIFTNLI